MDIAELTKDFFPINMKNKRPTNYLELNEKIVHYGGFLEGIEFLNNLVKTPGSTSVIIRGNPGTGKKSLINEVESLNKDNVIVIHISPYIYTDDFAALRYIAQKLKLTLRSTSMSDILEDIQQRSGTTKRKIIIVLHDFEEFCRQKQSLLYTLSHLTQHGKDISLIGLTISPDCISNLEKRVRSRINGLFYELKAPYTNKEEYVEFASLLLGGYKIGDPLKYQLEFMYETNTNSIRILKRYLADICSFSSRGVMTVEESTEGAWDTENDNYDLAGRIVILTKHQLELLKVAVCYCNSLGATQTEFTLQSLSDYARRHNFNSFDSSSSIALRDAATLAQMSLFKQSNHEETTTIHSTFSIGLTPVHLRRILDTHPELHSIKTDPLWKKLPRQ